jgi:hypothetical protein
MDKNELEERTNHCALRVISFVANLSRNNGRAWISIAKGRDIDWC